MKQLHQIKIVHSHFGMEFPNRGDVVYLHDNYYISEIDPPMIDYANIKWNHQQIVVLGSLSTKIKPGDYVLNIDTNSFFLYTNTILSYHHRKIIAAYPKLDYVPLLSQAFVKEYIKNPIEQIFLDYKVYENTIIDSERRLVVQDKEVIATFDNNNEINKNIKMIEFDEIAQNYIEENSLSGADKKHFIAGMKYMQNKTIEDKLIKELVDKKAFENNSIDLNAYAIGCTDMIKKYKQYLRDENR